MFKVEIIGKENIPETGNGVICSNHYSNYDPVSTAIYLDRLPHYIAKKELFKNKLFSWVLDQLGVFPIDRKVSMDMKAVKDSNQAFEGRQDCRHFCGRQTGKGRRGRCGKGRRGAFCDEGKCTCDSLRHQRHL